MTQPSMAAIALLNAMQSPLSGNSLVDIIISWYPIAVHHGNRSKRFELKTHQQLKNLYIY